jgi:hypothetical protein
VVVLRSNAPWREVDQSIAGEILTDRNLALKTDRRTTHALQAGTTNFSRETPFMENHR